MMRGMSEQTAAIRLGNVTIWQDADGHINVQHPALVAPFEIDPKQLLRWVMRQLREQVVL